MRKSGDDVMELRSIKNVAIYLRKSRGDIDDDILSKHRNALTEYARDKKWNYTIYEEDIASGERLTIRPKMLKLLDDIEDGNYNAVLVMAYDRLSRGSSKDFGTIIEVLQYANCYIATPDRIYDTNNTNDLTMLGIQGVFANTELRTIVNRLVTGKKMGAKEGRWTNGKPPYPYIYKKKIAINENGKEEIAVDIIVDKEKRKVYDIIKNMYLTGNFGTEKIMIEINKMGYPSPGGAMWSTNAIQRLLVHEFHTGVSIYGKYEWKKDRNNIRKPTRIRDKEEWFVGKGNWEILKTEGEHQQILKVMQKHNKVPCRAKAGVFPTSSLMYCKRCGYAMKYSNGRLEAKTGKMYNYTKCNRRSPIGEKCPQNGVKMTEEFFEALYNAVITSYLNTDIINRAQTSQQDITKKQESIFNLKKQLDKHCVALNRVKEAYLAEVYNLQEFGEAKKELDVKIRTINKEIEKLEDEIANATKYTKNELEQKMKVFKRKWKKATTAKEQNTLLKSITKRILYNRDGDTVTLEIEYL